MNAADLIPVLLLLLLGLGVGIGGAIVILLTRRSRARLRSSQRRHFARRLPQALAHHTFSKRPDCWVAIKTTNLSAVQKALGLHNVKPCTWSKGLSGAAQVFVAAPVRGWVLLIGSGLPDPADDPDVAFRFLLPLSRRFGCVQCFSANRVVQHHAWVRAEKGRVVRAYAWAGTTLWNQGERTVAERELDLVCRDYDWSENRCLSTDEPVTANVEKVPAIAARWSLDPGGLDETFLEEVCGIAGEPSLRY